MFKNYFKTSWRKLKKNKISSLINIFGLTVGLATCLLIVVYIQYENSYDKHFNNHEQIHLIATTFITEGKETNVGGTPYLMGETMQQEFPEIEANTKLLQIFTEDKTLLRYTPKIGAPQTIYEPKGYIADADFFNIFSYEFIEGNSSTSLQNPQSIVLSDHLAKKFFGHQSAINQTITVASNLTGGDVIYTVTGVFKTNVNPSHIDAHFFLAFKGGVMEDYVRKQGANFVNNNMFLTYLVLKPKADIKKLQSKFPAFIQKYAGADLKTAGFDKKQYLVALKDIHLNSGIDVIVEPNGNKTSLYILFTIAIFILIIACVNAMNLATASSSKQSAEVGVRKVLGAKRTSLIYQFLGESIIFSIIAYVLAVVVTILIVPVFADVSGKGLSFSLVSNEGLLLIFLCIALITGFLSGIYPAFYLSAFQPIKVLKGKVNNSLSGFTLRKGLVVFQFVVSVALIVATVVIDKQMHFMRHKELGFIKEQQVVLPLRSETSKAAYLNLKTELVKNKDVQAVAASVYYPGIFNPEDNNFYRQGQNPAQSKRTRTNRIDYNFLQTLGIRAVAGRLFSPSFTADTGKSIIINQKAVQDIGFESAEQSIGQKLLYQYNGETYDYTIIGVVKDFHFEDLQQEITPFAFTLNDGTDYNYLIVHGSEKNIKSTLSAIENCWKAAVPNEPLEYSFLDADFQKNYLAQERLSYIVSSFTILAIIICCLGLFALATFSTEQRIKEIGIRKVLGASVFSVVALLSNDFLKLVIMAMMVASPLAWIMMNKWLNHFAYRIDINWSVFAITFTATITIAIASVSFQAIKAAMANPVKSLKTD